MSLQHLLGPSDDTVATNTPRPYAPTRRVTAPSSVLIPISRVELAQLSQLNNNPLRRGHSRAPTLPSSSIESARGSQAIPSLPPKPQSLPPRPTNGGNGYKRSSEYAHDSGPAYKRSRPNQDTSVVANHYNARPNISRETRLESPIIGLKNFNNWIKSVLIAKFARREGQSLEQVPRVKVLDLGCGKGGDLQKWSKAGTDEYVGIDLAAVSVEQARSRWENMRSTRFPAAFLTLDCFEESITDLLPPSQVQRPFDVVSMQFCMHYAFETEEKARMMLSNVTQYLRPGGVVIGTIPDAENLLEKLSQVPEDSEQLAYGNTVYGIKFDTRTPPNPDSWFGHRYTFFLQDAVEEVPEYMVPWDKFVELAAEYSLKPIFNAPFSDIFADESDDPLFAQLLTRMKVVDADGNAEMDEDQLEAAMLYLGFALVKE
ncbi:mRNA (guanine-N7)-methyltransferase [Sporobolomyces salmoneus]|uniref:mRNA (guanine-N7)-methyltransferase n=1 Tax=Sporobolomyces salmoneus TaxID=183962 RepID=UPI00318026C8